MAAIYYDLSELYLSSGVKFRYYGIARTVMEVAYELTRIDPDVRYVVYSPLHGRFFEVTPRIGEQSPTGVLDHGLPPSATPLRLRESLYDNNPAKAAFYWLVRKVVNYRNSRRWATIPQGMVREVDLSGQILVSLGRPKIMSDYLAALEKGGTKFAFVPLLHDMMPLHDFSGRPGFSPQRNFLHDNTVVIGGSSLILANSKFTETEILHFCGKGVLPPAPPVVAVPLCHELRVSAEPVVKRAPSAHYLLCVGTNTGRKNLECVVEALAALRERGEDIPDLVLAGARRKSVERYLKKDKFASLAPRIHFVYNPNQAELAELYRNAFAAVLPSFMEGWGLPVSEALWCGTPALAADVPAVREAGGDLALYFDPRQPGELADIILQLQSDEAAYSALKSKIAAAKPTLRTWRDVAADILVAVKSKN
ncbi:Glycosyltransferase involved in cell wall bisynthesis [Ensifer adhaerens]|nr:Glycosyltransferase involved in cell wall bisynthesis [Ensifer adhaerens]